MYRFLGRRSKTSLENKLLCKTGRTVVGTVSNSNTDILQRFQNMLPKTVVNAPCYVQKHVHTESVSYTHLDVYKRQN